MKLKNDSYRKERGGSAKLLDLSCRDCGVHVAYYQKDGPGNLRRLYIDRIMSPSPTESEILTCVGCGEVLGNYIIFKKENRPAYRLYVDAITKKVVSPKKLAK